MAKGKSLRVYLQTHHDRRLTGLLLPAHQPVAEPPPRAYGACEADVLAKLEVLVAARLADDADALAGFEWEAPLTVHTLSVEVHPSTVRHKMPVIGKARLPLKLTYAACPLKGGAYQVLVPRFGWSFVLEDLSVARDVLRQAVSMELLGEHPRSLYDFRYEGEEYVREWELAGLDLRKRREVEAREEAGVLGAVADDLTERAARGKLPPLVPLDSPIASSWLGSCLSRSPRPSVLLVGSPGVGKTSWVLHLAAWLVEVRPTSRPL